MPVWIVFCLGLVTAGAAGAAPQEGRDYARVDPAVVTEGEGVEVVELFWYGCPHCYHLEPALKDWLADKPDHVDFRRVPAVTSARWAVHARAFYAGRALGVQEQLHQPLFEAIHDDHRRLVDRESLADFYAEQGVDRQAFLDAFDSFGVDFQVRRAAGLTRDYQISGVPTLIVDGRYRTSVKMAGSAEAALATVDALIEKVAREGADRGGEGQ